MLKFYQNYVAFINAILIALNLFALALLAPLIQLTLSDASQADNIVIHARGTNGKEKIALYINDNPTYAWTIDKPFRDYVYTPPQEVTIDNISVGFLNEKWEPENNINYDVQIDYINVDGKRYDSEHVSTSSTGTWDQEQWCAPGAKQSEWLHCNGNFTYNIPKGTVVGDAAGTPVCGNNQIESPEQCDDGNRDNGDGCNQQCQVEDSNSVFSLLLQSVETSDTSATINATFSDEAQMYVLYGTTNSLGTQSTKEESYDYASHSQKILNLQPQTKYFYQIYGTDQSGTEVISEIASFTTKSPEVAAPVCGNGKIEQGEQCDDSNKVSGDGCSASCQKEVPQHKVPVVSAPSEGVTVAGNEVAVVFEISGNQRVGIRAGNSNNASAVLNTGFVSSLNSPFTISGLPQDGSTVDIIVSSKNGDEVLEKKVSIISEASYSDTVRVAIIGDSGTRSGAENVLQLIKREDADMLYHLGDMIYEVTPEKSQLWESQINQYLGKNFPVLGIVGNHEREQWPTIKNFLKARADRIPELTCEGTTGSKEVCSFRGITFLTVAPGISSAVGVPESEAWGSVWEEYITDQFSRDNATWRICGWHKNQNAMQVGGKSSQVKWPVYEACRQAGAIVATGHEHNYSRTHLLSSFEQQTIVHKNSHMILDEGQSFAFVNGLGGYGDIREQQLAGDWWASIYTATQNAKHGALFCDFGETRADCYFKNIDDEVIDSFSLESRVGS